MKTGHLGIALLLAACTTSVSFAQTEPSSVEFIQTTDSLSRQIPYTYKSILNGLQAEDVLDAIAKEDTIVKTYDSLCDSLLDVTDYPQIMSYQPLPPYVFMPSVFTSYVMPGEETDVFAAEYSGNEAFVWIEDAMSLQHRIQRLRQNSFISSPESVRYNVRNLPLPPKEFTAVIKPEEHTIEIVEKQFVNDLGDIENQKFNKIHWLHTFNGSLQFSQAYISPNWYQGGNNNLNMLLNLNFNVKLNQKLHPTLLFETNAQYKLGLNSAPDDSLRAYNISEDLFQVNSTFGIKAFKKWYYTVNAVFKTQLVNSFKSNTYTLRSAFLSPGELNVGVGMTYNTANKKRTFTFDASISPLSYNLMMCFDNRLDKSAFNIEQGKNFASKYGSSVELKMFLQLTSNIRLNSRFFGFTDYDRAYCDLENTLVFEINRFLTTQVFCHLRYDTITPQVDPNWHKLQVKEILSLGFAYKFSTI